jgi:predicted ATPase
MFKSMRLKNFKAYKDSGEIPLAPLTIIVGTNNSGKSTLFHALLALAQTARASDQPSTPRLITKGPLIDLNGYHDIIHGKVNGKSSSFEISIGIDPRVLGLLDSRNGRASSLPDRATISFSFDDSLDEIGVQRATLSALQRNQISATRKNGSWSLHTSPIGAPKNAYVDFRSVFPFFRIPQLNSSTQELFETMVYPSYYAADFFQAVMSRAISHIGPLRERVPWNASVGARASSKFGSGGENLVADLASTEEDRFKGKTRLELLNGWLATKDILKQVRVETNRDAKLRMLVGQESKGASNINIAAMGEGVSQILPIIAYSLFGMNDDCLLVEQPEIHLHPALQAELGELFIDVAQTGHRQILVETHSEHLVLRVRRRVAEGKLSPEDVAILFVEKQGGESKVRRLGLTERGHFGDTWPPGFFDEAYQESMALAKAANRKGR